MSLQNFGERWIDVAGTRTRYFEAGDGEPIILIHGGAFGDKTGAANAEDWDRNFPLLAKTCRVISIDRLGQGLTDLPNSDANYTMAASVAHVVKFLEALGHGPYHVVGHSRGGYVACRVALDRPDLVRSCVIVDSATCSPGVERNDFVFACNPHAAFTREACLYTYAGYSYSTTHVTEDWVDLKMRLLDVEKNRLAAHKMHTDGLQETVFYPGLRADREDLFMRLKCDGLVRPVLLIWGFNDPTAPLVMGQSLFSLLAERQPRTRMHIINQAGHFTFREQPAAFNSVLLEHIEAVCCGA